jgi:orotidine-5'-phosphate decarboxylase
VAEQRGAGIYVLVRTSNPGAGTFQDRQSMASFSGVEEPLYRHVAQVIEQLAVRTSAGTDFGCVGAVCGATYPQELAELRQAMPHVPFLVPGYGSQGAGAADVAAAFTPNGLGALVNSSRAINFAHSQKPFAQQFGEARWHEAVEAATKQMIADLASNTPAGALQL